MAYLFSISNKNVKIKLSKSAIATLNLLHNQTTPLTVKTIKDELPYSTRTIQYALQQLRRHALVEKKTNFLDLRESNYRLSAKASLYGYSARSL
jgi:predicted transcriptional regulator